MARVARIKRPSARQESFTFRRPQVAGSQAPSRTRHKKGRIRRGLKKVFAVVLGFGAVGLVFAWTQGYTEEWLETTSDYVIAASIDAGFALEGIKTAGLQRTTEDAVYETLGIAQGDALLAMSMSDLEGRLEAMPWVRRAVVSRELPATVKVLIYEREPFARWQIGGEVVLVDDTAAVITGARTTDFASLPFIVGPGAPDAATELFNLIATTPELAERVVAAVRVGHRRWDLEFDNGMRLKLPEKSETYGEAQAWEAFIGLTNEKNIMALDVAECDLRLPDRIVMRLTPEGREAFETNDQET